MANVNRVNGFQPAKTLTGAPWNGQATRYVIAAADTTAVFVGDLVTLDGTTGTGDYLGIRGVSQAAAGEPLVGAVVGFDVDPGDLDVPQYRAASTQRGVWVVDDPSVLFVAQEDGDTDPLEMADVGLNVNFIVGAGSTVTGASGMQIDSSSETTLITMSLKLIEPLLVSNNELVSAGQAYTRWVVKINNHCLGAGTGTIGV